MAITRPRGASRSVWNQNTGPSLPMKLYWASKSSSNSTIGVAADCQVLVEDAVLALRPLLTADDQVAAVFGHVAAEAPFLLVGPLVDQLVLGLRRAELVVVELLVVVDRLRARCPSARRSGCRRSRWPSLVHEAPGELDPLQMVVAGLCPVSTSRTLVLDPVRAGAGQAVGQPLAVLADRQCRPVRRCRPRRACSGRSARAARRRAPRST